MKLFFGEILPEIKIDEAEQTHILKVLRMKSGDEIYLTDGKGNAVKGNLVMEGKRISLENIENLPFENKSSADLHIAICPTKNIDRIEFFLEKAIEMGVQEVSFLQTDHSERKNINFEKLFDSGILLGNIEKSVSPSTDKNVDGAGFKSTLTFPGSVVQWQLIPNKDEKTA